MGLANGLVSALLRSPVHGLLSKAVCLVRYTGRRSGRTITTPVQYATHGDDVLVLVGRPDTKTWWHNFATERDAELLIDGTWRPMTARAVVGSEEPDTLAPLLDAYLTRFPRVGRSLGDGTTSDRCNKAVMVRAQPRSAQTVQ